MTRIRAYVRRFTGPGRESRKLMIAEALTLRGDTNAAPELMGRYV